MDSRRARAARPALCEALEPRLLLNGWLAGNKGTFVGEDGDTYTVKLTGPGQVAVTLVDPDVDGLGDIDTIVLDGTDPLNSKLTITARSGQKGQPARVEINSITRGGLKSLTAKYSDLVGTGIDLDDFLGSLTLHDVLNTAKVAAAGQSTQASTVRVGTMADGTSLDLGSQLKWVKALELGTCTITAPAISSLTVSGSRPLDIDGNCYATLVLSGQDAPKGLTLRSAKITGWLEDCTWTIQSGNAGSIRAGVVDTWTADIAGDVKSLTATGNRRLQIGGDIGNVTWTCNSLRILKADDDLWDSTFTFTQGVEDGVLALGKVTVNETMENVDIICSGHIGSINVKDWMEQSSIRSVGNIASVKVRAMEDSTCFAGVTATHDSNGDGVLDLPDPATEIDLLAGRATIKSFKIMGDRSADYSFLNSNVAAAQMGLVKLAYVQTDSDENVPFCLAADFIKTLTVKWEGGGETYKNLDLPADSYYEDDCSIVLV